MRYEGPNQWAAQSFIEADFKLNGAAAKAVIVAEDGQLITKRRDLPKSVNLDELPSGLHFIAVCNRYNPSPPAVALIEGFGSFNGALASSVAHDSHNVVAVSNTRSGLAQVVNAVMEAEGGLALVQPNGDILMLPLPIAGLLSAEPATEVAAQYQLLDAGAKALGCPLRAPFMTLSFMALLVIPELKLSDKGLFDGLRFEFIK